MRHAARITNPAGQPETCAKRAGLAAAFGLPFCGTDDIAPCMLPGVWTLPADQAEALEMDGSAEVPADMHDSDEGVWTISPLF